MQRCELAEECCVCNVPFCPYNYLDERDDEDTEEGWWEDDGNQAD